MMKKITALLFAFLMTASLTACAENNEQAENISLDVEGSVSEETAAPESSTGGSGPESEPMLPHETEGTEPADAKTEVKKVLVAYFSATNTTEGVAEHIANGLNADLYEIVPE